MDLAVASADELALDINASKESAATFIMAAQKLLRDSRIIEEKDWKSFLVGTRRINQTR